ncbi:MAG: LPS assembly lipoprotein LptE [Desulforhopalus sp.]|nr:LPS assembly lipoprotein LptE [Desulforhopalus sp.]
MKPVYRLCLLLSIILGVAACGYHNPNIYNGPHKSIYITEWKNRTSELGLDSKIYRSMTKWFQKSGSISTVRNKEGADLILGGEIVSLELPSLSYGINRLTAEVKVRLRVRYMVKEISTNKILIDIPDQIWEESYLVSANGAANMDNEAKAIDKIIEDLSQKIYQKTISGIPKL